MAGAATADAAIPAPATLRNSRRFMGMFLPIHGCERCECNSAHPRVILKLLPLRPAARKFAASLSPGRGARKGESPRHADPLPPNVDVKLHLGMDATVVGWVEPFARPNASDSRLLGLVKNSTQPTATTAQ